jgi:signal peptidase I
MRGECAVETASSGKEYSVIFSPGGSLPGFGPTRLEPQQAFVMGDNRDNSVDSRYTGPIDTESITGRAVVIWFSYSSTDGIRWNRIGTAL